MTVSESAVSSPSAQAGGDLLTVANIEVIYDDVILVLRGMSLSVPEGAIVALLGSNGAGKSTTLKAISGLLPVSYTHLDVYKRQPPHRAPRPGSDLDPDQGLRAMLAIPILNRAPAGPPARIIVISGQPSPPPPRRESP